VAALTRHVRLLLACIADVACGQPRVSPPLCTSEARAVCSVWRDTPTFEATCESTTHHQSPRTRPDTSARPRSTPSFREWQESAETALKNQPKHRQASAGVVHRCRSKRRVTLGQRWRCADCCTHSSPARNSLTPSCATRATTRGCARSRFAVNARIEDSELSPVTECRPRVI
jgi:hypothetical protein